MYHYCCMYYFLTNVILPFLLAWCLVICFQPITSNQLHACVRLNVPPFRGEISETTSPRATTALLLLVNCHGTFNQRHDSISIGPTFSSFAWCFQPIKSKMTTASSWETSGTRSRTTTLRGRSGSMRASRRRGSSERGGTRNPRATASLASWTGEHDKD